MPWFKVDDSFESHPKVKSIPKARRIKAIGVWTLTGAWSARHLTDGFVPDYMVSEIGGSKYEANSLVDAGLWSVVDGGYTFHDWHDWQPTKAKVEADRDAAKERMRAARERKKPQSSQDVRPNDPEREQDGSAEVRSTPGSVTPTRPDPTRPDRGEDRAVALRDDRSDVVGICQHLADRIEENGAKRPTITKGWLTAARLMLDNDGRPEGEVHQAIEWATRDSFWMSNILSMPKLREKYDQLKLQASRPARQTRQQETDGIFERSAQRLGVVPGGGI
jgi:hypothetical protein